MQPIVLLISLFWGSQNSSYFPPTIGSTSAFSGSHDSNFSLTVNKLNA
ncbi:MAG: hypothetical protein ACTSWH_04800 [Promethearchaeota archaeon]